MLSPIYEALFDCNVIFKGKFSGICTLQHERIMRLVARQYLDDRLRWMNKHDNMLYKLFRKTKGDTFMVIKAAYDGGKWGQIAAADGLSEATMHSLSDIGASSVE